MPPTPSEVSQVSDHFAPGERGTRFCNSEMTPSRDSFLSSGGTRKQRTCGRPIQPPIRTTTQPDLLTGCKQDALRLAEHGLLLSHRHVVVEAVDHADVADVGLRLIALLQLVAQQKDRGEEERGDQRHIAAVPERYCEPPRKPVLHPHLVLSNRHARNGPWNVRGDPWDPDKRDEEARDD